MSERWPGGIVRATPVTPTGPLQNGTAPGMWTLDQANYWIKQGLWPTAGNFLAVEDVFSTWLYTGTGSAQTITNGIDLAGKGGMVWIKSRSSANINFLTDTLRGTSKVLDTASTAAQATYSGSAGVNAFNQNGFSLNGAGGEYNASNFTYASWTFREAANFFDVVTWTGNNVSGRAIPHNLGITPGCIIVKRTSDLEDWWVYHRSGISIGTGRLNLTDGFGSASPTGLFTSAPTATEFYVSADAGVNASGSTYVAYLFAHDTSSTGLIQCGGYTGNGSSTGPTVTLGWEPQWVMIKNASTSGTDWVLLDNMRGIPVGANDARLLANASDAETTSGNDVSPTPTGFQLTTTSPSINTNGNTYIYIAIRRGPMRIPTLGTTVFAVDPQNITISSAPRYRSGFVTDMFFWKEKNTVTDWTISSRLTGTGIMSTNTTAAEISSAVYKWDYMNGALNLASNDPNKPAWMFRRAPSFFDEVCYTGTGSATTFNHNLGVAPELMIVKPRGSSGSWRVYAAPLTATKYLTLNQTAAAGDDSTFGYAWNKTAPTSTVFSLGTGDTNSSGVTHVNYLFASCPGVSKVGSYTGTGTTQTINCDFTTGARFVLIKRTDSTGDWYLWDSARGIVAGNDPYLLLNSTAAEVTGTDYVDTDNSGFQISSTAPAAINANGGTFIYLAIS